MKKRKEEETSNAVGVLNLLEAKLFPSHLPMHTTFEQLPLPISMVETGLKNLHLYPYLSPSLGCF